MTTRFHVGARQLRGDIAAYSKRFDLLEVQLGGGRGPDPSPATFRRWRRQVPPTFDFTVVVGPNASKVKASEALDKEVAQAIEAADALEARCILVKTPIDVTPSALWRDRIAKLAERLHRDGAHVVWQPTGVWELEDAAAFAKKIGIVLAVDAARDAVPHGPVAYARLPALGETRSYGSGPLEVVVMRMSDGNRRDAYVVFETDGALAEAKRLRSLAQRARSGAKGGMSRIVRPAAGRGGMIVRDDEQE